MTTVRPRISRATGLTAALAAVALIAAACSSSGLSAQEKAIRKTGNVTLKHACTASLCSGTRAGAAFQIQLPQDTKKWNGTLVIWSHGYREAAPIVSNPLDPSGAVQTVDRSAQDAPSTAVANALLAQGYALAGSAFATNGWDVLDGVNADQDLYTYFSSTFGKPDRVYIWGASLGGLITQTLAEKNLDWVSGVAPLCGVLGGTNLNLDLALDVAYAVKQLVYPQFKISGYSSVDEAVAQWEGASKALVSLLEGGSAAGVADVFAIGAIAGAPAKTEMFDGSSITSSIEALGEGIINALGYSTWGRYDLEQRVGGNPSQNTDADYNARLAAHPSPLFAGDLSRIQKALSAGTRVAADPAARAKADTMGDPTGAITKPTITFHTEDDPLVLVQNENVFAQRVATKNARGQLVQLFSGPPDKYSSAPYGAGHCNFTTNELTGVVTLLDNWVHHGVYPGPGAVANALNYSVDTTSSAPNTPKTIAAGTATTGYDPNFAAPPWPAASSG